MRKISILIIIGLIGAGCIKNPFSTRESNDPYGAAGTWETPQSPDVTVRNLLFAYNEMIISYSRNQINYGTIEDHNVTRLILKCVGLRERYGYWESSEILRHFVGDDTRYEPISLAVNFKLREKDGSGEGHGFWI